MRSIEFKLTLWGAIVAFASGLLFFVPGANAVALLLTIAVLSLVVARLGMPRGILMALPGLAAVLLISSLIIGYQAGIKMVAAFSLAAIGPPIMMGFAARRMASPFTTICAGLIPFVIIFVPVLISYGHFISTLSYSIDVIVSEMRTTISNSPMLISLVASSFPPADGSIERFLDAFKTVMIDFFRIFPGFLALSFIATVMAGFIIAGAGAARYGIIFPMFRPFYLWRASGWWLLLTILGLIPLVATRQNIWFYTGLNILIVTAHVYLVVGLAIMESVFRRMVNPRRVRALFYGVLVFLGLFGFLHPVIIYSGLVIVVFLVALGLADSRFNFRRESFNENND